MHLKPCWHPVNMIILSPHNCILFLYNSTFWMVCMISPCTRQSGVEHPFIFRRGEKRTKPAGSLALNASCPMHLSWSVCVIGRGRIRQVFLFPHRSPETSWTRLCPMHAHTKPFPGCAAHHWPLCHKLNFISGRPGSASICAQTPLSTPACPLKSLGNGCGYQCREAARITES